MSMDGAKPEVSREPFLRSALVAMIVAMSLVAVLLPASARAQTLVIELNQGPFDDPRVAQAVGAVADWHVLADQSGLRVDDVLVRGGGREERLDRTAPDLDRARLLMAEAGHAGGEPIRFWLFHDRVHAQLAAVAARTLRSAWLEAELVPVTPQTLDDAIRATRIVTGQRSIEVPYLRLTQERLTVPEPRRLADLVVVATRAMFDRQSRELAVQVEIANLGAGTAGPHQLAILDRSRTLGFPQIPVDRLGSRQSRTIERSIRVPDEAIGRIVVLQTEIDSTGEVAESNERNNSGEEQRVRLLEPIGPPDLVVVETAATFDRPSLTLAIRVTIANTGTGPAAPHLLSIFDHSGTVNIPPVRVASIGPGQSQTIEQTVPVPDETLGRTVIVQAEIDSEADIRESDEGNNVGEAIRVLLPAPPTLADLVISEMQAARPAGAGSATVSITVSNRGGTPSEPTSIKIAADGSASALTAAVPALPPGSDRTVKQSIALPAAIFGRDVRLTAFVDPEDLVPESVETNNRGQTSLALGTPITTWIAAAVLTVGVPALLLWVWSRARTRISQRTGKDQRKRRVIPARVAFRPRSGPSTERVEPADDGPALVFRMALRPVADAGTQAVSLEDRP